MHDVSYRHACYISQTKVILGFVTPVMSQFTGLKVTYAFDFPLVSISSLAIVSMVTTVGTFNYGRYYLKTHHALRQQLEL